MAEKKLYSRPQLFRTFRITEKTLNDLEKSGKLELKWTVHNGLKKCSPNASALRVLTCAANHVDSFAAKQPFTLFPFHRFLCLRFLQMPAEDLHLELLERNLIHSDRISVDQLTLIQETFLENLPDPFRKRAVTFQEPTSKIEKAQLDTVLSVCDIELSYHHPELESAFSFMSDADSKVLIDSALSTQASFEEVRLYLEELLGFSISVEGLAFYQSLFHDLRPLSRNDLSVYLKQLKPSSREYLKLAVGRTLADYRVKSNLEDQISVDATLQAIKDHTIRELIQATVIKTPESAKDFSNNLRSLMMILDREDQQSRAGTSDTERALINKVFSQFTLEEPDLSSEIFELGATVEAKKIDENEPSTP